MHITQALTDKQIRLLAAEAECDERTVRKYLQGAGLRGLVASRISRALQTLSPTGDVTVRGDVPDGTKREA